MVCLTVCKQKQVHFCSNDKNVLYPVPHDLCKPVIQNKAFWSNRLKENMAMSTLGEILVFALPLAHKQGSIRLHLASGHILQTR